MVQNKPPSIENMEWLTLNDALDQIRTTCACSSIEAQRYLKEKIYQGQIFVKWKNYDGSTNKPDPTFIHTSKLILRYPGYAYDRNFGMYFQLLVSRPSLDSSTPDREALENISPFRLFKDQLKLEMQSIDRANWMTLVEAVEHIQNARKCDIPHALMLVKNELSDGVLTPHFLRPRGIISQRASAFISRTTFLSHAKLTKPPHFLLLGIGLAKIATEYIPIFLARQDVTRLFPSDLLAPQPKPDSQRKIRRPTNREAIYAELAKMRDEGEIPAQPVQKRLASDVTTRCGHKSGDPGWNGRTVISHVSNWLRHIKTEQ